MFFWRLCKGLDSKDYAMDAPISPPGNGTKKVFTEPLALAQKLSEVVYTPESQLRDPRKLFLSMWRDLLGSRELAWRLLVRNIRALYRQTMLGYLWAFLPPIFTTLTFVFLNSQKILSIGKTDIPYPAFVMIGMLLWQVFVDAMHSPLKIINQSKPFLSKIHFPREALIMAGLGEVVFNFLIRLVLLVVVILWYRLSLPSTIFWAPLGILALMLLGLMFGILLAPIGVLYMDIEKGLPLLSHIWLFLTPVVYPSPTNWPASIISRFNPVSPLISTTRDMLTTGSIDQMGSFSIIVALSFIILLLGWILYRLSIPFLIERINV